MGRGIAVTNYIHTKIREMHESGATIKEIMDAFSVSRQTVYNYCHHPSQHPNPKGCPLCLSSSDCRRLFAISQKNPTKSAKRLAKLVGLSCSSRTIQRELRRKGFYRECVKKTTQVPSAIAMKRMAFAKEHLPKGGHFWKRVIFSDEKKWNLKGNDGYVSIWREKTHKYTCETDLHRRPGIMVWGAICENGAAYICRIKGRITAAAYQKMLEDEIFGVDLTNLPEDFVFQQDNAPVHVARSSIDYFKRKEIPLLTWPTYSPDLNIIENLWGIVSNKVYEDGREYKTADELWDSVSHHFLTVSYETIKNLYQSIPGRLISVIEKGGKRTDY